MARGRPKLVLDEQIIYDWARVGCSAVEIANYFDCDDEVINRRYAKVLAKARAELQHEIRQEQLASVRKGNTTMLRWLGQQFLGQSDVVEVKHENTKPLEVHWQDTTSPNNTTPVTSQPTTISAEVKETP